MDSTTLFMLLVIVILLAVPVIVYSLRVRDAARIGRFMRLVACYGMVGIFGFIASVMVMSTVANGDVMQAVALAAIWVIPPVAVALWMRRGAAGLEPALWTLTGLACVASAAAATSAAAWWDFANVTGPYFQVAVPMVGVCLAIWSLREPVRGGVAMIVLGLAPILILSLAPGAAGASMLGSLGPLAVFAVAGAACLIGERLSRSRSRSRTEIVTARRG